MADTEERAKQGWEQLKRSGAKEVLAEFLRMRLLQKREAFTSCTKDTFEVHKGRCLELNDLLNDLLK